MKKAISVILCLAISLSLMTPALAYRNKDSNPDRTPDIIEEKIVDIIDENGMVHKIPVTIYTYFPEGSGISTQSFYPEYPVGTKKTFTINIDNAEILEASEISALVGTTVGTVAKDKIAEIVAEAVGEELAGNLITGLVLANIVTQALTRIFLYFGFHGFNVTITMVYDSYYSNREDYYIYGWNFYSLDNINSY